MERFNNVLEQLEIVVRKAGEFQLEHFRNLPIDTADMKAAKETVSFVDIESERILIQGLEGLVPAAGYYGEESGRKGNQDLVWIVDPLDGTTNFLNGVDHFSISVALVEKGIPVLGAVYKPYSDDYFCAAKGQGFYLNGKRAQPAYPDIDSSKALFITGFPYRSEDLREAFFSTAPKVLELGLGIRRSGSAALDLSYLAAGWYHGFWESDLQPYDVAAGLLFLAENGVKVSNGEGGEFNMFNDRLLLAAYPNVHKDLLAAVKSEYRMS